MPTHCYEYAIIRVMPRVERQEFINVGLLLSCHPLRYLATRLDWDEARLKAFAPSLDLELVREYAQITQRVCQGEGRSAPCPCVSASTGWWHRAARSSSFPPCIQAFATIPARSWSACSTCWCALCPASLRNQNPAPGRSRPGWPGVLRAAKFRGAPGSAPNAPSRA